ncbi:MAG: L-histidine N(alpha)-methyltransferase [Candidatus Lambdaproteobacteria bacterium]|nr:L-histidine N(alpha)-methyltransferase [Candidatus Lambdaproteobacteria bacterium]
MELTIHPSATMERLRERLWQALEARRVPGFWLYGSPAQIGRWLAYHDAYSPSRDADTLRRLYRTAFDVALARLGTAQLDQGRLDRARPAGAVPGRAGLHLVSLGCGGGGKDLEALAAFHGPRAGAAGPRPPDAHYTPVDASAAMLSEACGRVGAAFPGVAIHPLVADLEAAPDLAGWWAGEPSARLPRLVTCFAMLSNFEPAPFCAWLRGLLRGGDVLLLSAHLTPGGFPAGAGPILAQYDNPAARGWLAGALTELGLDAAAYELTCRAVAAAGAVAGAGAEETWQVAVEAALRRSATLAPFGRSIALRAGERLRVFHSNRFTLASAAAVLAAAGLQPVQRWSDAAGEEGLFLCRRAT